MRMKLKKIRSVIINYYQYYFYLRCADGFMGQRCEFKDLDGSYLRK